MIALALLLVAPVQTTWYVDQAAAGPGTGTQLDPYSRVDFAVSSTTTVTGDTVLVLPGVYSDEAVDFGGKDLIVRSTGGASVTTLEAVPVPGQSESIFVLKNGETSAATIEGLTLLVHGGQSNAGQPSRGGGVACVNASVTLRNVEIAAATSLVGASHGGGIYIENGGLRLAGCTLQGVGHQSHTVLGGGLYALNATVFIEGTTFVDCHANAAGIGLYAQASTLTVVDSDFAGNRGSIAFGGAMALSSCTLSLSGSRILDNRPGLEGPGIDARDSQLVIHDTLFRDNSHGADSYPGGALRLAGTSHATVRDSQFVGNSGQYGGAIYGSVNIDRCVFDGNIATGGGQYGCSGGAISGGGTVRRSVFRGNTATDTYSSGGGALAGGFTIEHCTFVGNTAIGGASAIEGVGTLSNSIVRGGNGPRLALGVSTTYSNIDDGAGGMGNVDRIESFWPDLALLPDSPSIDAGDPMAPLDFDGTRADMGAFPFDPFHCGDGCNGLLGLVTCAANDNSTGQPAALLALGDSTASANLVVLNVTSAPSSSLGFFLGSRTQGNQPLGGGSQGLLCLGGSVLRFSNSVLSDRGTGVFSFRLPLTDFPQGNVVQAGDTWNMQFWFRDANPQATSNTSSAIELTFQ